MTVDLQAREIQPLRNTFDHVAKYVGSDKPASRYQEATFGVQATSNFHYRPTWDPEFELFDARRSKVVLKDWYVLKDPRQFYYATWTMTRARQQDAMESNYQFVESRGLIEKTPDEVKNLAVKVLTPLRHVSWGGNMNNCSIAAYGYGTAFTAPASFHAMDQLGVAQYITRLSLAIDGTAALDAGKKDWLDAPEWQPLRRYVEDTLVNRDPFELFVAQNFALDGQLNPLIYTQFIDEHLTAKGGTVISMLTSFMPEWHDETTRWIDAVIKAAAAESPENQSLISGWAKAWAERAQAAIAPVAQMIWGDNAQQELDTARAALNKRMEKAGLTV
jgi:phenol hydroxylase P1 protein